MHNQCKQLLIEFSRKHRFERSEKFHITENSKILTDTLPALLVQELSLPANYEIKGSVGRGNWAEIPRIAIFDTDITDAITKGYYVAFLFNADLDTIYLTLALGWTQFQKEYGTTEARKRIRAFSEYCVERLSLSHTPTGPIDLSARSEVGRGHEQGTIISKKYNLGDLDVDELRSDIVHFIQLYRTLKQEIGEGVFHVRGDRAEYVPSEETSAIMTREEAEASPASCLNTMNEDLREEVLVPTDSLPYYDEHVRVESVAFPWFRLGVAIVVIALMSHAGYVQLYRGAEPTIPQSGGENSESTPSVPTLLSELEKSIQPLGYFDDMSVFSSETLSSEAWRSHVTFSDHNDETRTHRDVSFDNSDGVFSPVVKIVCQDGDDFVYGSGTNVDPFGYVLTNRHVVQKLKDDACIVGFPDPSTGRMREAYWTTIIRDEENATGYDLAYLAIERPVFDMEGNIYGYYDPITNGSFPYVPYTDVCVGERAQPGDEVLLVGYPQDNAGAQMVTSGFMRSLPSPQGHITTSAHIERGNSGGLAIRDDGCFVGVLRTRYDNGERNDDGTSEIISAQYVSEFDTAVDDNFERYYKARAIETATMHTAPLQNTATGTSNND